MPPQPHPALRHARSLHRLRRAVAAFVGAAALASGLLGAAALAEPATALAAGPLPACRYDDILTAPRAYADWGTTLVDTILRVPKSYVPPDLVSVKEAGLAGTYQVRAILIPDLTAMAAAAAANGTPIAVQSAYRSYTTQIATFQYWVNTSGYAKALLYSARPGHSEHQLGLAIDFKSAAGGPPWSGTDWGTSPAGAWMKANAWQYGFIQSYPKGKVRKTCYDYESWHFRYVGIAEAALIHASGLTLREYLWSHYTTAVVPPAASGGSGGGTGTGTGASQPPSAPPSAAPSAIPSDATSVPASLAPGAPSTEPSTPSVASFEPSAPAGVGTTSGAPNASGPPAAPVGALLGLDPTGLLALGALIVVSLALLVSVALARRNGGGGGRKGRSGVGLPG